MKFQSSFLIQMTFLLVAVAVVPGFAQETDTSGSKTGAGVTKPAAGTVAKPAAPAAGTVAKPAAPAATVSKPITPTASTPARKHTPAQIRALVNRDDPFKEKVNRRTPLPFKPFEMKDAQGRPIQPDTILTLPNGKKMSAAEYFDTINAIEQRYAALGYSLREKKPRNREVVLEEPALDRSKLLNQKSRIQSAGLRVARPPVDKTQAMTLARAMHTKVRLNAGASPYTAALPANVQQPATGFAKNWNIEAGDEDYFYGKLTGRFELQGALDKTTMVARGKADTEIFQRSFNLLDVDGEIVSRRESQPLTFSLDVSVFGNDLVSLHESQTSGYTKEGDKSAPIAWDREFPFQVGPIPMSIELGIAGRAGLMYSVEAHPVSASGMLMPYVHTKVWADLALVELQVADAGVTGELTLVNDDLFIIGSARTLVDEDQKPYVQVDYDSFNNMKMLGGRIRLFACVWVLDWGGWEEDCIYKKLWDWEGFEQTDSLFSGTKKIYL